MPGLDLLYDFSRSDSCQTILETAPGAFNEEMGSAGSPWVIVACHERNSVEQGFVRPVVDIKVFQRRLKAGNIDLESTLDSVPTILACVSYGNHFTGPTHGRMMLKLAV